MGAGVANQVVQSKAHGAGRALDTKDQTKRQPPLEG
jgi:hypothetical protein